MEHVTCDVLILGSGAAGLRAAISAREQGLDVLVLCKAGAGKSTCTGFSGGVMGGAADSGEPGHLERSLTAGRGLNQRELTEILSGEAPFRLNELTGWGMRAELRNGFLFAQGRAPVLGEEIIRCLLEKSRAVGVRFMANVFAADLVMENGSAGVMGFESRSGRWTAFSARAIVLATGGAAALYLRHDNPRRMLGEGCRLALDAGAILQDMEFVQFYPLCLAIPGYAPLVVPPRLADHGLLLNEIGENILQKYGIDERPAAEKARDRLSQALFKEIYREGRRVHLDLRRVSEKQWLADPFSASMRHIFVDRQKALERPLPVAPAAHHTMGGVRIDSGGATSLPGLFAAGEVTGGLHGANRMGGNALSETIVFGARAGNSAAEWAKNVGTADRRSILRCLDERLTFFMEMRSSGTELLDSIREIMWRDGGIVRNDAGLSRASKRMGEILSGLMPDGGRQAHERATATPTHMQNPVSAIELFSAARIAGIVLEGAARRTESRGSHCREDHPEQNDSEWRGHLQVCSASGKNEWKFVRE